MSQNAWYVWYYTDLFDEEQPDGDGERHERTEEQVGA